MADQELIAFWIKSPLPHTPLGFGVTAWSLEDALGIIGALGYDRYLPADLKGVEVRENITVTDLDQPALIANMGPINVRGLWYPFWAVGVPRWAEGR